MPSQNKVRVRIAVVVNANGAWNALGWNGAGDEDVKPSLLDMFQPAPSCDVERVYYIEADLPVPTSQPEPPIEGSVTP